MDSNGSIQNRLKVLKENMLRSDYGAPKKALKTKGWDTRKSVAVWLPHVDPHATGALHCQILSIRCQDVSNLLPKTNMNF